ncbi:Mycothiol maleylpyruvate isomerase N-terminal domain-containing protein [Geodermatophilus pulveris]|uniref:Mycothiol maleylpyruvate isomerase N-terminal domain-containing protein n=1 Tax=Geodermatophilus pulveris TaxID=1564159 RepID=A0A239DZ06_9ACTN|nr:maleylpyruvate isomerase N-terminal domain-containing protein [Geodermatophilus pulveris]SNS37597.1 Mycothiol maleylpyruvate isomerase N-terminal domain-containing protein [Geodermatophilus pulveris]
MTGDDVRAAVAAARGLLGRVGDGAAEVPALGTSVAGVVAHVAGSLAWYAHDLVAGPAEVSAADQVRRPGADLPTLVADLGAWGEVLARVVDASPPDERGWHPDGRPDASGFAAMGCAEALLHAHDVAVALALHWSPPTGPAAATLARLFPRSRRPAGTAPTGW